MPAKHSRKIYIENGYYHVYNRGVEKRIIFLNDQDYRVLLTYLQEALSSPKTPPAQRQRRSVNFTFQNVHNVQGQALYVNFQAPERQPKNFSKTIQLIAFCLMPNHFHFLLKQTSSKAMHEFIQSLLTRYTMYFNKKYKRVGALFQGRYKAIMIDKNEYLLHLSRYIHRNPLETGVSLKQGFSSYNAYLGTQHIPWLNPEPVLAQFIAKKVLLPFVKQINTYKMFVEQKDTDKTILPKSLSLELL